MTAAITVTGLVQGVGYRPFVAELAEELELTGEVKNAGGIVTITAAGEKEALEEFVQRLRSSAPKGALVREIQVRELAERKRPERFVIAESADTEEEIRLLPPDLAVCPDCERELRDPQNRRYRHPFISCTACGPRFSIMERVPYDRETITMRTFPMCAKCRAEYSAKGDRRRHAQTIACKDCGPRLMAFAAKEGEHCLGIMHAGGEPTGDGKFADDGNPADQGQRAMLAAEREEALALAVRVLRDGGIVAVKDIGGFHLAFLPDHAEAAVRLREFKNREKKPFAVMFRDLESVQEYCEVSEAEEELLCSNPRPIVLLERRPAREFAPQVCADSKRIGAMLPCNPLQILLLEELGPLVMTSGNRGGEPIITKDADMRELLLSGCPDLMLTHEREILTPLEDSVCQVTAAGISILRRGRGFVPEPVRMARALPADSFAAGGDLKAVFALGKGHMAYLSAPFGDLEDYRCAKAREASARHMSELLNIHPKCAAADLHPAYYSVRQKPFGEITAAGIQHHHAHILSVMAEHGLEGPTLGVAFDGTGYGTDGSIWGGEFLLCERNRMERIGGLSSVTMAGGDAAAKDAAITLWCYLLAARERGLLTDEEFSRAQGLVCFSQRENLCDTIAAALGQKIGTYACSSMGRLFDAVSALLGICSYNSYEGECAILLEQEAQRARKQLVPGIGLKLQFLSESKTADGTLEADCTQGRYLLDSVQLIVDLLHALGQGEDRSALALAFHRAIVHATVKMCAKLRAERGISETALSGGCFCNRILLDETAAALSDGGFRVYRNEAVPCGDGGIALGQLYALTFETGNSEK